MGSLFIADLHLCETHPRVTRAFPDFLGNAAPGFDSLYILGDLFGYTATHTGPERSGHPHAAPRSANRKAGTPCPAWGGTYHQGSPHGWANDTK